MPRYQSYVDYISTEYRTEKSSTKAIALVDKRYICYKDICYKNKLLSKL